MFLEHFPNTCKSGKKENMWIFDLLILLFTYYHLRSRSALQCKNTHRNWEQTVFNRMFFLQNRHPCCCGLGKTPKMQRRRSGGSISAVRVITTMYVVYLWASSEGPHHRPVVPKLLRNVQPYNTAHIYIYIYIYIYIGRFLHHICTHISILGVWFAIFSIPTYSTDPFCWLALNPRYLCLIDCNMAGSFSHVCMD